MIRVSGADSLCAVDRVVRFDKGSAADSRGYTLKHGDIPGVDEVVVGIYRAPHSYTGEDSAEICCHASPFIAGRILDELCASGCRLAEAGEFTRRAFTNGKMDLAQAEAVADLIASGSEAQHRVALNQLRGGYSAELAEIRSELLELTSLIELELDFSEEEVEFADRDRLASLLDDVIGRCTTLADSFKAGNAIRNGVPVAIVGAPNSGKSTLLKLCARFYEPGRGIVRFAGMPMGEIEPESLMERISMVFQDVYLFQDTIRNNIRFGKADATEEEIMAAAKKACCHDFIMKLPQAYDTLVGEGGCTLSGGERQRISIARAILKDAPVVLLDEATASLDPENEVEVQKAIDTLIQGHTVIVIAHRLSTIQNADKIVVINDGKVAEQGTHEELLKLHGAYYTLYSMQFKKQEALV